MFSVLSVKQCENEEIFRRFAKEKIMSTKFCLCYKYGAIDRCILIHKFFLLYYVFQPADKRTFNNILYAGSVQIKPKIS
jgi:hypothetical protein